MHTHPDTLDPATDTPLARLEAGAARQNTISVRSIRVDGERFVVKVGTGRCRAQLRIEAEVLAHIEGQVGPTVVALRERDDRTDLVLEDLGGRNLADLSTMGTAERIRVLRRCAEAIDRLHRSGWSHGAVCAEHVAVDGRGSVRLCSFGSARPLGADPSLASDDLHQMLQIIDRCARLGAPRGAARSTWRWIRRQLLRLAAPGDHQPLDARQLAARLSSIEDRVTSRPTFTSTLAQGWSDWSRRAGSVARPLIVAVLLAGGVALGVTLTDRGTGSGPAGPAADRPRTTPSLEPAPACTPPSSCPSHGPPEVEVGAVTVRVGEPGDLPAASHDGCSRVTALVLLRPDTGEVFTFDEVAGPGRPVDARLVGRVDDAARIDPPTPPGCEVVVHDHLGQPHTLTTDPDGAP